MQLISPYWAGYLTATNTTELCDNDISFIFKLIGKTKHYKIFLAVTHLKRQIKNGIVDFADKICEFCGRI